MAGFGYQIADRFSRFGCTTCNAPGGCTCCAGHGDPKLDSPLGHGAAGVVHGVPKLGIAEASDHWCESDQPSSNTKSKDGFELKHDPNG